MRQKNLTIDEWLSARRDLRKRKKPHRTVIFLSHSQKLALHRLARAEEKGIGEYLRDLIDREAKLNSSQQVKP